MTSCSRFAWSRQPSLVPGAALLFVCFFMSSTVYWSMVVSVIEFGCASISGQMRESSSLAFATIHLPLLGPPASTKHSTERSQASTINNFMYAHDSIPLRKQAILSYLCVEMAFPIYAIRPLICPQRPCTPSIKIFIQSFKHQLQFQHNNFTSTVPMHSESMQV
jgi:hypothetical protein